MGRVPFYPQLIKAKTQLLAFYNRENRRMDSQDNSTSPRVCQPQVDPNQATSLKTLSKSQSEQPPTQNFERMAISDQSSQVAEQKDHRSLIKMTHEHVQILEYTDALFTRQSLRKNIYLYKHMKNTAQGLEIPIFVLAEERKIMQTTQSHATLVQALAMSDFVTVSEDERVVRIIDYPTVKAKPTLVQSKPLPNKNQSKTKPLPIASQQPQNIPSLPIISKILKQYISKNTTANQKTKPPEYIISKTPNEEGYHYIVLKMKKNPQKPQNQKGKNHGGSNGRKNNSSVERNVVKQIIDEYNKSSVSNGDGMVIQYREEELFEDIRIGINKFRKAKKEYAGGNSAATNGFYQNPSPVYQNPYMNMHQPMYPPMQNMGMQGMGMQGMGTDRVSGMMMMNRIINQQQQQQQWPSYEYSNYYQEQQPEQQPNIPTGRLPIFIRKAVESEEEEYYEDEYAHRQQYPGKVEQAHNNPIKKIEEDEQILANESENKSRDISKNEESRRGKKSKASQNQPKKGPQKNPNPPKAKNTPKFDDEDFPTIG